MCIAPKGDSEGTAGASLTWHRMLVISSFVVRRLGGDDTNKDILAPRQRVFDASVWLQANNPFYSDISIDADALAALPHNGARTDLPLASEDRDLDEERDTGSEQDGASEGGEYIESFLRSVVGNGMQENAMIDLFFRKMLRAQRGSRAQRAGSPLLRASEMGLVNGIRGDVVDIV